MYKGAAGRCGMAEPSTDSPIPLSASQWGYWWGTATLNPPHPTAAKREQPCISGKVTQPPPTTV